MSWCEADIIFVLSLNQLSLKKVKLLRKCHKLEAKIVKSYEVSQVQSVVKWGMTVQALG